VELYVCFHGDWRVLEDIRLLADKVYGEDDFGNNLPLPERLAYLRKWHRGGHRRQRRSRTRITAHTFSAMARIFSRKHS